MTNATEFFDMNAAPLRVGRVRLKVRDLETVSRFYQSVLGLAQIGGTGREAILGTGDKPLLVLEADPALAVGDRFTVLIQGRVASQFRRGEKTREEVLNLMAGGEEFDAGSHGD